LGHESAATTLDHYAALTCKNTSAPGRIRTCDTGFRRACKLT
jgi:hypothetical protein